VADGRTVGMFERRKAQKAQEQFQQRLAQWQQLRDGTEQLLELAETFTGDRVSGQLLLQPGESLIGTVTGAGLIEERRGPGHWQGRSSGWSVPVASIGGHAIRYHVGQSRGHYVQGAPTPVAVDAGTLFVTDQRAVFQGAQQTRECRFAKLLGVQYGPDGSVTFSVSNRQKPTTVHYGPAIAGWVRFRVELALARFRGTVPQLLDQLRQQLAQLDQTKPSAPAAPD
jgi:hypothetical protein